MKTNGIDNIDILKSFINDINVNIYYEPDTENIIVDGDVIVFNENNIYQAFPVKIYKVNGNIHWNGEIDQLGKMGTLSSLKNFPDIVTGDVIIFKNPNLKSLEGCPKEIGGTLQFDFCNVSDISGISKVIGKNCIMNYNPITDLSPMSDVKISGLVSVVGTPVSEKQDELSYIPDSSIIVTSESDKINYTDL